MLAALNQDDLGYRLLLLGHILFIIVGFGSSFVWPFLGAEAGKRRGPEGLAIADAMMKTAKPVTTWAIWLAGAFGVALAIAGDRFGEAWVGMALGLFVAMVLFAALVHVPNLEKMNALGHQLAAGPPPGAGAGGPPPQAIEMATRAKAAARNGGILHLAFFVVLILMIWQPN